VSEPLRLLLRPAEGALLRLLGTVQRRGFELAAVRTTPQADGALWLVELQLAPGPRDVANLRRQIEKLYDVERFVDAESIEAASA
jgi:acetolactate synthase II small subunit